MKGRGYDQITITEPGDLNAKRLAVAAPQVSWDLSGAGAFSAFARQDDLRRAGLDIDIKGFWLTYESVAGRWGGVISGRPTTNNVVEIIAEGNAALLRGHVLDSNGATTIGMTAGGAAKRVIMQAGEGGNAHFVTIGAVDEGGAFLSMDLSGDAGTDLLPQIAAATHTEWTIDADRVFTLSRRFGKDRSPSIRLIEDRHIASHRVNDDTFSLSTTAAVFTELPGVLAPPEMQAPPSWLTQPPGIGANNPAVPADPRAPIPTIPVELTLINKDNCFTAFDLGDTVRVELGSIGLCGRFRGISRGLDVASQTLTVSGELLRDA